MFFHTSIKQDGAAGMEWSKKDHSIPANWDEWKKCLCFPYLLPRKKQLSFGNRLRVAIFAFFLRRKGVSYFSSLMCQR